MKTSTDQDYVWAEMLAYWEQTGQIGPGRADAAFADLSDEQSWRDLGYSISYGAPFGGGDPQGGPDAPWHFGVPAGVSEWAAREPWVMDTVNQSGWAAPAIGGAW